MQKKHRYQNIKKKNKNVFAEIRKKKKTDKIQLNIHTYVMQYENI